MKFSIVLALVAAATAVSADTNAQRLARGLSPNAPGKRATPAHVARHSQPSNTPGGGQCNTGHVQCCNSVQKTGDGHECDDILNKLGVSLKDGTNVGVGCSPIVGNGAKCGQEPVCCENNEYSGLINIGCSPTNIDL